MKGFLTCLAAMAWIGLVIFHMERTKPQLCRACGGIDPRFNHTDTNGEWLSCDRCRGSGYERRREDAHAIWNRIESAAAFERATNGSH